MRFPTRSLIRSLAIALAFIAAGCSSMHSARLSPGLDPLVGQPVSAVVDRYGPPSSHYASSTLATTYQWDNFGAAQSGMTGCRVLVEAKRSYDDTKALSAYGDDSIFPEQYWKWTTTSWSSFGSGCK